jgi:predicted dehydrogenase
MEAMWTRFQPAIVAARALIEDGAIGESSAAPS